MDGLHMSYTEVMTTPYVNLVVMMSDKLRIEYEPKEEVQKLSGREMLEKKKQNQNK